MVRPQLEWLEGRFVPTAIPPFAGLSEFAQFGLVSPDRGPGVFDWPVSSPFAFASPTVSDSVFSMGQPVDPLMGQIGRLPEPSLEFAPSGHGGNPLPDELLLWPATAPLEAAPSVEQVDELFLAPEPELVLPEE